MQAAAAAHYGGAPLSALEAARLQALAGHDAEEQRRQEREAEQAKLDGEMEKRRKRIQAWQEQRRKDEAAAAAADATAKAGAEQDQAATAAGANQKAWTFEDESSEDEDDGQRQATGSADGDVTMQDAAAGEAVASVPAAATAAAEEDEVDPLDAFMQASVLPAVKQLDDEAAAAAAAAAEEVDPLDAFMQSNVLPAVKQLDAAGQAAGAAAGGAAAAGPAAVQVKQEQGGDQAGPATGAAAANGEAASKPAAPAPRRRRKTRYDTESSEEEDSSADEQEEESEDEAEWMRKLIAGKMSKGDKLTAVDHSTLSYPPFRRNFYIEVPELARMSAGEVEEYRKQLDGIKVRGKDVPKPVKNWNQCGLSTRILDVLKKGGFERPLPIQAQALPIIMSGRDCIGVAKTGSGKTLAFVLPMMRHIKDQPALAQGDGPVALGMAPTRELVTQIGKEVKRFAKTAGLTCVCVYGGSGVANQISELKRGTEVVICTPGRMIDILVTSAGKITNLRRVTYLVLDEADRMFDMGFEPQIMRIVQNIRPDRQTVMFSATFPRQVEVLARQVLNNPVEIQVGGRSVVNKDITQFVELRPEEDRFLRLLEVLGEWYEKGKLLIFVSSQDRCDTLFRDLLRAGYPCLSLHGGKDQSDRESTIVDYKANVCNILVATSVAARGLDVKDLVLVVNYDVPNHHEDYVHRVGRTGRAGAKGTAITFIGPDEEQYAPDLVKALRESSVPIPKDLLALADAFEKKRKEGRAQAHNSGFGGSGFKFDASEDNAVKAYRKSVVKHALKAQGEDAGESESEDDGEIREVIGGKQSATATALPPPPSAAEAQAALQQQFLKQQQQVAAAAAAAAPSGAPPPANPLLQIGITEEQLAAMPAEVQARVKAAQGLAARLASQVPAPGAMPQAAPAAPVAGQPAAVPWGAAAAPAAPPQPAAAAAAPPMAGGATWQPPRQPPPPPGSPPPPENPILAAAQAVARRLAKEAGIPFSAYTPQQPGGVQMPTAAQQQQQMQQQMQQQQQTQQQAQQPQYVPGMPGILMPGAMPALPASLAAQMLPPGGMPMQLPGAPAMPPGGLPGGLGAGVGAGQAAAAPAAPLKHFETELEINDFPQHARWKVTHRETIRDMGELGAAVVVKGKYYKLGTAPGPLDERKLYLHIEAPTAEVVKRAKHEIKRILEETTEKAMRREAPSAGRYSVM
ncbi:hypothetical protein D9Q98_003374 [Chlorella vulgaris]|uniref:RNA helicase n=1 Tax=Chlorella vulgaris TaxID=3077 RepID=A0A9D4YYQ5_CHLVU|nr:hypothetical protein D9Q98_003374 [Chlorella vulgaris]